MIQYGRCADRMWVVMDISRLKNKCNASKSICPISNVDIMPWLYAAVIRKASVPEVAEL